MGALLVGASCAAFHSGAAACYGLLAMNTKFCFSKWTRIQAGALVGTSLFNISRPYTQRWLDKKLTEQYSCLLCDLTPFIAIGLVIQRTTKTKIGSFLTGAYFASVHKAINCYQYTISERVWDKLAMEKRAEPTNYYEELALKKGQEQSKKQEEQRWIEKLNDQRKILLIQSNIQKGIPQEEKIDQLRIYPYTSKYFCLLKTQIESYIDQGKNEEAIAYVDRSLETIIKLKKDLYSLCYYDLVFSVYSQTNQTEKLKAFLKKMEAQLPQIPQICPSAEHAASLIWQTVTIATGYCHLEDYENVDRIMGNIPWEDYDNQGGETPYIPTSFFEVYNKMNYGKDTYGEGFFARWNLKGSYLEWIQNEFRLQAALKAIASNDFEAAEVWAEKVSEKNNYRPIAEAFLKSEHHKQAIKYAKKMGEANFTAEVLLSVHQKGKSQKQSLRQVLEDPKISKDYKTKINVTLDHNHSDLQDRPVLSNFTLYEITKNVEYLHNAIDAAERTGIAWTSRLTFAKELMKNGHPDQAISQAKKLDLNLDPNLKLYELVIAKWIQEKKIPADEEFTQSHSCRLEVSRNFQKAGLYEEALAALDSISS